MNKKRISLTDFDVLKDIQPNDLLEITFKEGITNVLITGKNGNFILEVTILDDCFNPNLLARPGEIRMSCDGDKIDGWWYIDERNDEDREQWEIIKNLKNLSSTFADNLKNYPYLHPN